MSNIYDRQQQFFQRQVSRVRYCSFCGKPMTPSPTNEDGTTNENYEWEMQNRAHYKCVMQHYQNKMREQVEEMNKKHD